MHSLIGIGFFFFSVDFAQAIDANQGLIMLTKDGEWLWNCFQNQGLFSCSKSACISQLCMSKLTDYMLSKKKHVFFTIIESLGI